MGEFRNDREAAHLRADALEHENRQLRDQLAGRQAPPARNRRALLFTLMGVAFAVCLLAGFAAFFLFSRPAPSMRGGGLRFTGAFVAEPAGVPATLRAAEEADGTWLVGDGGTIMFRGRQGDAWQRVASGTTANLRGVTSGPVLCAVGDRGTVLVFDASTRSWAAEPSGTTADLHAVVTVGADLVAVGSGGTALHRAAVPGGAGPRWTPVVTGVDVDLHAAVRSPMDSTVLVVGDRGVILSGPARGPWVRQTSPTSENLRAVAARGGEYVAVGDRGTVVRTAGVAPWSAANAGTARNLLAVAAANVPYEENTPNSSSSGTREAFLAAGEGGVVVVDQLGSTPGWRVLREGGPALHAALEGGRTLLVGDGGTTLAMVQQ